VIKTSVSVVMPVRNEAGSITRSLGSVLAQDYPHDRLEVIVVDGSSEDGTPRIVRELGDRSDIDVKVLDNPKRIVPAAMNLGIAAARGDIIVRVDGHCEIPPTYVSACVEALEASGADNAGGLQRAVGTTYVGRAIAAAMTSRFGVGGARFHYAKRPGYVDTVYLGTFRRELFDRIGGYDEDFVRTQDAELNFRLTRSGGRIWLDPSISVVYHPRPSLRGLARQYFEYGLYKALMLRKRGGIAAPRQLAPPAFLAAVVASLVAMGVMRRPIVGLAVIGPYALVNLVASVLAAGTDPSILPVLPLAFAVMHLAWGAGFYAGLYRFRHSVGEPPPDRAAP
jgi:glycosyltransferase involved in cell wall biosynthesis